MRSHSIGGAASASLPAFASRKFRFGAFFGGTFGAREIVGGIDQKDVGEGLREVANRRLPCGSYSSERRPTFVAQAHEPFEDCTRFVVTVHHREVVASQKVHGRNTPSPGGKTVDTGTSVE